MDEVWQGNDDPQLQRARLNTWQSELVEAAAMAEQSSQIIPDCLSREALTCSKASQFPCANAKLN